MSDSTDEADDGGVTEASASDRGAWHTAGAVLGVLSVVSVVAFRWFGRRQWFHQDEWDYLAARDGGSIDGLLVPHNEHLTAIPIALFRVQWNLFGLHHYLPYQLLVLTAHVLTVWLLWAVMRRCQVSPWPATVTASLLLFYGAGSENMVWAFQVGFVGGLAGGLGCVLLGMRPGSIRSTAGAIAAGAAGLLSAGTGLITVTAAIAAIWAHRGWRRAATIGVPLAVPYAWWWANYAREDHRDPAVRSVLGFARIGIEEVVATFTATPTLGTVMVAVLAGGLVLLALELRGDRDQLRTHLAVPVVLALGAVGFLLVTGRSRVENHGGDFAKTGRYGYVTLALLVPLIATGIEGIRRRWEPGGWALVGVLAIGLPFGMDDVRIKGPQPQVEPGVIGALASEPWTRLVPEDTSPFPGSRSITVGWLRRSADDGKVTTSSVDESDRLDAAALAGIRIEELRGPGPVCDPLGFPVAVSIGPDRSVIIERHVGVTVEGSAVDVQWSNGPQRRLSARTPVEVTLHPRRGYLSLWCPP